MALLLSLIGTGLALDARYRTMRLRRAMRALVPDKELEELLQDVRERMTTAIALGDIDRSNISMGLGKIEERLSDLRPAYSHDKQLEEHMDTMADALKRAFKFSLTGEELDLDLSTGQFIYTEQQARRRSSTKQAVRDAQEAASLALQRLTELRVKAV